MTDANRKPEQGKRLLDAYRELLHGVKDIIEESPARLALADLLARAVRSGREIRDYTQDEFERASYYLQRDVQDLAHTARHSREELGDWLRMDIAMIEEQMLELMATVADPTRVELDDVIAHGFHPDEYLSGEITGPGVLHCADCRERVEFPAPSVIPPCPNCGGTRFGRELRGAPAD